MIDEVVELVAASAASGYSIGEDPVSDLVLAPVLAVVPASDLARFATAPSLSEFYGLFDRRRRDAISEKCFGRLSSAASPHGECAALFNIMFSDVAVARTGGLFEHGDLDILRSLERLRLLASCGISDVAVGAVVLACAIRRKAAARKGAA